MTAAWPGAMPLLRPVPRPCVFFGLRFAAVTRVQVEDIVVNGLECGRGGWVAAANLDVLRQCAADSRLTHLLSNADYVVADGMPLVWSSRLAGTELPERVAGSDLISTVTARLARAGRSVYLLGGSPGAAKEAATRMRAQHPALRIAGTDAPPYGFEQSHAAVAAVVDRVVAAKPDMVFVGLGFPKQDQLIMRLREACPDIWCLGVGVSIDFAAGRVQRAPSWTHRIGLEWVYRLTQEPKKLFGRYVVHGIPFAVRLFAHAARQRVRAEWHRPGPDRP